MTTTFPPLPWSEGDTFVNSETQVEYTYTGERWLASGGKDADLSGLVKKDGDTMTGRLKLINENYNQFRELVSDITISSDGSRPIGELAPADTLMVWHLDANDAVTTPRNELKFRWDGAQEYVDSDRISTGLFVIANDGSGGQYWYGPGRGWVTDGNVWHFSATTCQSAVAGGAGIIANNAQVSIALAEDREMLYATEAEAALIAQVLIDQNKDDGEYLPITGGTVTGNLNVGGQLKVTGEHEFKVEYNDGSNFLRVRPDNDTVTVKGAVNADGRVKGSELVSTKLTSGQNSNLEIFRGSGDTEDRKMLVGDKSVNFDVSIKLVSPEAERRNIQVQNGTKIDTGGDEIITFGGSGAFYRGAISQPDHFVNKEYVDDAIGNIDIPDVDLSGYLPLTGGNITGATTIDNGNQVALTIKNGNSEQIKFWGSGAVALTSGYSNFKDNELVTKEYVDGKVASIDIPDVDLDGYVTKEGESKINGKFSFYNTNDNTVLQVNQGSQSASSQKYLIQADGQVTQKGLLTMKFPSNGGAVIDIQSNSQSKAKIWSDGTFTTTKTSFTSDNLVTKAYVDANAGGVTPGEQVAKLNGSAGVAVGGFYIQNGNVFCKIS